MRTFFLGLLLIFAASPAHAQFLSTERVVIDMSPGFPGANTPLTLTARSTSRDLSLSTIRWYVNDVLIEEGEGRTNASATTGGLGTRTRIFLEVLTEDGTTLTAERTIVPAEVDLLWETDTYVPPFYRGKRLASPDVNIRVAAVPRFIKSGTFTRPEDLIYTWRRNDAVIARASGKGKSSATLPGPELFGADTITVEVTSSDGSAAAASTLVQAREPVVRLYQDHPLFGTLYHRALGERTEFSDVEATFAAHPFFADASSARDSRLQYGWRINNTDIAPDDEDPSHLTINAQGSSGDARLDVSITHGLHIVMDSRGTWRLMFNRALEQTFTELFGNTQ